MKPDDFEKRLQRQPLRPIPTEWREEVLSRAHDAYHATRDTHQSFQWREFLVSLRWHLAGMSAAWLIALFLNTEPSPPPTATAANPNTPPPEQLLTSLRENRRQLLEMIEPVANVSEPVPVPHSLVPRRRSEFQSTGAIA